MNEFQKAYKKTIQSMGGFEGSLEGEKYVNNVEKAINKTVNEMIKIGKTNKDIHYIKGDIAEPWHAGTIKIYATAKGLNDIETFVPRNNSPIDIIASSPTEFLKAQLKYYKTAEDTTKAISNPKYAGLIKIVPSDQLESIKEIAHRLYLKNLSTRPELAKHYLDTYNNASDILKIGGAPSTPLTEKEAFRIAKEIQKDNFDPKLHGLTSENFIQLSDIIRESGEAALNAALITAILKATPHIKNLIVNFLQEGKVNTEDLKNVGLSALSGAGEGYLRGGIAAIITASCKSGILGTSVKSLIPKQLPFVVAGATVIAMNAVHNAIGVYKGKISEAEFAEACLRDSFVISFGILGASVGAKIGASIGQGAIPIPILGAIIGNVVGTICATIVYEGIKNIYFSFFIKSGVSFWKIVQQNYELPRKILEECGFELIDYEELDYEENDNQLLKRGVIKINRIGYIV